jgi:hypothetical protein
MAQVKKTVLGRVSGALGDIVFRERYGKNFVGVRPGSFIPGTDPVSVTRRLKFLLAVKFSQAVHSEPALKSLWEFVRPQGMSLFNNIIRNNYAYVDVDSVSDLAKIVPGLGFGISASSTVLTQSDIQVAINPIGLNTHIDPLVETRIQLVSVLFFSNPLDPSVKGYYLTNLAGEAQPFTLEDPMNFNVPLFNEQTLYYQKFRDHKGFVVLVTLNSDMKPVRHSSTLVIA